LPVHAAPRALPSAFAASALVRIGLVLGALAVLWLAVAWAAR
jgi:hypothetical protein